jgi:hypothetical protein
MCPGYDVILELNGSIFQPVTSSSIGSYLPGTDPFGTVGLEAKVRL